MAIKVTHTPSMGEADLSRLLPGIYEYLLAIDPDKTPCVRRAKAFNVLMDAHRARPGDLSDDILALIADERARPWSASMGWIGADSFITYEGMTYIALQAHNAQYDRAPGSLRGLTLFRPVREEPSADSGYVLDFTIGEHVPFGAIRRDPVDGKYYTPVKVDGVTLYDHRPGLVPSEYCLTDKQPGASSPTEPPHQPKEPVEPPDEVIPKWVDLPDNYLFAVGNRFIYNSKTYVVLREFGKQSGWAPPALIDDFYKLA